MPYLCFFCKNLSRGPFLLYSQQRGDLPPIQRRAAGGGFTLEVSVDSGRRLAAEKTPYPRRGGKLPPTGGRESRCSPAGTKGDRTPGMVSCPLLTPLTFLCAATPFGRAAKRGMRGLGSVRQADFETLLCPEFTLCYPPRITVRGHPVQGGSVLLRKAPLRSRVCSWSSKRPCGPLAFRRATEGSRVQRRVWGRQEGAREPYGALAPFCLRRETPAPPPPGGGNPPPPWVRRSLLRRETPAPPAVGYGLCRLQRRAAVSAERLTLC